MRNPNKKILCILLFLLTYCYSQPLSREKFTSYRPYPYVFLHGRGADAEEWGFDPFNEKDALKYGPIAGTLHENRNSSARVIKRFFKQKGYAEQLYTNFLGPFECNKTYRTNDAGEDVGSIPNIIRSRVKVHYSEGINLPPATCQSDSFYVDFEQISPDITEENYLSLPANQLPDKETWGMGKDSKKFIVPLPEDWDKTSFNHSYIEAYQGNGYIDGVNKEVLSKRWGDITLVDIARKRIKEVLDEYYGAGNWECDSSKKVILVGYSTGISVAGGVIYHDQQLLKNGKPVLTWCHDNMPTAGNIKNARELLSSHIAWVMGHNPVVAGSHWGAKEPWKDGIANTIAGFPLMFSSFSYLFAEDAYNVITAPFKAQLNYLAAQFGALDFPLWMAKVGSAASTVGSSVPVGTVPVTSELIGNISFYSIFKSNASDKLAVDLGATQDYFTELRSYNKPPLDILTINDPNPRLIEYKTIATNNFLYPEAIDKVIYAYFLFNYIRHFPVFGPEQRPDRFVASITGFTGLIIWRKWAATDIVLSSRENETSGKALNKNAKVQHKVLDNIAHANLSEFTNPGAYPFNQDIWDGLRPYFFDPPVIVRSWVSKHKCINHPGDVNYGCQELKDGTTIAIATPINKKEFYTDLRQWKDQDNLPQQPDSVLFDPTKKNQIVTVTDGGGSPLAYEAFYNSNLMATDTVESYVNGQYKRLKFRRDYGSETDPLSHSARIRVPLTGVGFTDDDGKDKNPIWRDFESILQDGGNIVGFRGRNPAGTIQEKKLIRYDRFGIIVSTNDNIKNSSGAEIAKPTSLNLGAVQYKVGNFDPKIPEVSSKGILFAFRTDQIPEFAIGNVDKVKAFIYGTTVDGQIDRTQKVSYTLNEASLPLPGKTPQYDPFATGITSGSIYLSPRVNSSLEGISPHQLFFWIKPDDLLMNKSGRDNSGNPQASIEGIKHAVLLVTKPSGTTEPGNKTFYQMEFAIDNTPPGNVHVFSPTSVGTLVGKSYEDNNGNGDWKDEMTTCEESATGLCDPGVDGYDNNGNGQVDEVQELRKIKSYSQMKKSSGERINPGIFVRFSIEDNMQAAFPFTEGMIWRILGPGNNEVAKSGPLNYNWGAIFNDFYEFKENEKWSDGVYSLEVGVKDAAGNALKSVITKFLIDNSPPKVTLANSGSAIWSGNQSGLTGRQKSLLQNDSYSSTLVKTDEECEISIKLTPKSGSGSSAFIINSNLPASLPSFSGSKTNGGFPLLIHDNFDFLELNGFVSDNQDKYYKKLPDGKYSVEVFATDNVGNETLLPISEISIPGFDFVVDKTPPAISLLSVLPFYATSGTSANLNVEVNQNLDNGNTATDKLEYSVGIDENPPFKTAEGTFYGLTFNYTIPIPASLLGTLAEGPHRLVLTVSEKDAEGLRNHATLSTVFVNRNWGLAITRPSIGATLNGLVPIEGRVADPFIEDQQRFSFFRLSYVPGFFDTENQLPGTRLTAGLKAVGSQTSDGNFETPLPDNIGVWDTRVATTGQTEKQGDFTLILEAFQTDGQKKTTLSKVLINNGGNPPAQVSTLEFTNYEPPYAGFKLTGKPAQIILSVFKGQELVNKKSVIAGPLDFDSDYFPNQNHCVVGVSEERFRIRFHPGDNSNITVKNAVFAFLLKGFLGTEDNIETKFYDGNGQSLDLVNQPGFVSVLDGTIQYSPTKSPLPNGEGAVVAEILIPLSLLDGNISLRFGNSLFDLLNPGKSSSPYLPSSAIEIGAAHLPALTNPFTYDVSSVVEWKETNHLGEEVEPGEYTLKMEGYTLDGKDYVAATPSEKVYQKITTPKLRIANARVGADPLIPYTSGGLIKAQEGLSFSLSRSAYVTVSLYKVGDAIPTQQVAGKLLLAGGYNRIIDFLKADLKAGQASLEEGTWYYFRIVAVSQANPSDVCIVSTSETECYDKEVGAPLKLDFKVGKIFENIHFWNGLAGLPFVLTSKTDSPDPINTQKPIVITPVSEVSWKVEDLQGKHYPPITVNYKVKKKGVVPQLYLGYDLKVDDYVLPNGKSATQWNFMRDMVKNDLWIHGNKKSRYSYVAVKKDWGSGKIVRFTGASRWGKGTQDPSKLVMNEVWNGGSNFGFGPAVDGTFTGLCEYETKGSCYDVENHPAWEISTKGWYQRFDFTNDDDDTYYQKDNSWLVYMDGAYDNDGFLQAGHWEREYNNILYSEFGYKGSFEHEVTGIQIQVGLNMNITRTVSHFDYLDNGAKGKNQLVSNIPIQMELPGTGSLRHMKFKSVGAIGAMFIGADNETYRFEDLKDSRDIYSSSIPNPEGGSWISYKNEDGSPEGFPVNSRDYFKVSGKFILHGLTGEPINISIPNELVLVGLENRKSLLGGKNVLPTDYVTVFKKSISLNSPALGPCMGNLEYEFLWKDENTPYKMNATWLPSNEPGCELQNADKTAVSETQTAVLKISPFNVTPATVIGGVNPDFVPYSTYFPTNESRFDETPINQDLLINDIVEKQLGGLVPVDWDLEKAFDVEIISATYPDGTAVPGPLSQVEAGFSSAPDHILTFRIKNAESLSKPLASKAWGGFKSKVFTGPVLFDTWVPAALTDGYCHVLDALGNCYNPLGTTQETFPEKLFHHDLKGNWSFNKDISLTRLRTVLRNTVGAEHPQVTLLPTDQWRKSDTDPGFLLKKENLVLDPGTLSLSIVKGISTPQRFVSERLLGQVDHSKTIETHLETDNRSLPIRTVLPREDINPISFDIGQAQGPLLHVTKTFGSIDKAIQTLERIDMRTLYIGQVLDLNSDSPTDRKLLSPFARIGVQFQKPIAYSQAYGNFIADVVPVDLQALAFKYPSANIPYLDQLIAPAFSIYPTLINYKDFPGTEPTVTYYLRKDEVTDNAISSRNLSAENLSRIYAINTSSGELNDMTAFVTLVKKNESGGIIEFEPKVCLEFPSKNPNNLQEEISCGTTDDFQIAVNNGDWDYVRLIGQPRIFATTEHSTLKQNSTFLDSKSHATSLSQLTSVSSLDEAEPEYGQLAFLPMFNSSTSELSLQLPPLNETLVNHISIPGKITGLPEGGSYLDYQVEFGHGLKDEILTIKDLQDAEQISTTTVDADGNFSIDIADLKPGRNIILARIIRSDLQEKGLPIISKTELIYFSGDVYISGFEEKLISNLENREVNFRIQSKVSGRLSINIFSGSGKLLTTLSGVAQSDVETVIPWDPTDLVGLGNNENLSFTVFLSPNQLPRLSSVSGTIDIDYTKPKITISSIQNGADSVEIRGNCSDGRNDHPIPECQLVMKDIEGNVIIEMYVFPDAAGDFLAEVLSSDIGEVISNNSTFLVSLSATQISGNSNSVTGIGNFDFKEEPVIRPNDLTAVNNAFSPKFTLPEGKTGELFYQGSSNPPSLISEEGIHLLSATTLALGKIKATKVNNVLLDTTRPVLNISGLPQDGSIIHSPVQIQASFNDRYLVNGRMSVSSDIGSTSLTMEYADDVLRYSVTGFGAYRIKLSGVDLSGNTVEKESKFVYDNGAPKITPSFLNNDFVPILNGNAELRWNVLEDQPDWTKSVTVSLDGIPQSVVYTDIEGRAESLTRLVTKIPVDILFAGSGRAVFTVSVPGEPIVTVSRSFRISQTGPELVTLEPADNSRVPRNFEFRAMIHSDVGLDFAEAKLGDGKVITSAYLVGQNDYVLVGNIDYLDAPLDLAVDVIVKDKLGRILRQTLHYSIFEFQVMIRDNAFNDRLIAKPQLEFINNSATPLSGFTARLWLSRQEYSEAEVALDPYVKNPCGVMTKVTVLETNANVVTVDFIYPPDYVLPPTGKTPSDGIQIGLHFLPRNKHDWIKSNDWSWQGVSGTYSLSKYVTVYNALGQLIYGKEPDVSIIPKPGAPSSLLVKSRTTSSLVSLYLFHEGFGNVASDVSKVGIPLDLKLTGANIEWIPTGGLNFSTSNHNSLLENGTPNLKLFETSVQSGELSIEAWVEPANISQNQAQIIEYGSKNGDFGLNWGMLQNCGNLEFRLRTSTASTNYLTTSTNPIETSNSLNHIVMTYQPFDQITGLGGMRIYVNGKLTASNQQTGKILSIGANNWSSDYIQTLGNHTGDLGSDWAGKMELVSIYSKALSQDEVNQNFEAGIIEPVNPQQILLGVTCGDRVLPITIHNGAMPWQEDKLADLRRLTMGGTIYSKGLSGQPKSDGKFSWLTYDLVGQQSRLGILDPALKLTGFVGKQDGSAPLNIVVKTSENISNPSTNDWTYNSGGVIERFNSDVTNIPLNFDLRYSKWLAIGMYTSQTGSNFNGIFGDLKIQFSPTPPSTYVCKLNYSYFEKNGMSELPDFDTLTPLKSGFVDIVNLSNKLKNDNFAMEFKGFIKIETEGIYTFFSSSDDGSRVFIDGVRVVNNNYRHANQERSGQIVLTAGYHPIKVQFFENDGDEILEVKYQGPGLSKRLIPANVLFHSNTYDYGVLTKYFEGNWYKLPSFESLMPLSLDIRKNFQIFPRLSSDRFGMVFYGNIFLPKSGDYKFFTESNDGSRLFIDEKVVVDNDGQHAMQERSGTINLSSGFHSISVNYFNNSGTDGLSVKIQGPDLDKVIVPSELLFYSSP